MLGQVIGAQIDLERALAEIASSGGDGAELNSQLSLLASLQRSLATADPSRLAAMRGEVLSTVASAQAVADRTRNSANADSQLDPEDRKATARATLAALEDDLFNRHVLDPYLQFANAEDEREYRRREAERLKQIEDAKALGTPQGDALAASLVTAQIRDAGAHGANRSPDYLPMLAAADDAERAFAPPVASRSNETQRASGSAPAPDDLSDAMAALRDAGVTTLATAAAEPAHGLSTSPTPSTTSRVI